MGVKLTSLTSVSSIYQTDSRMYDFDPKLRSVRRLKGTLKGSFIDLMETGGLGHLIVQHFRQPPEGP